MKKMKINYDEIANNYSKYREIDNGVIDNILRQCNIDSNSKVLEIGCGTGNYIINLFV